MRSKGAALKALVLAAAIAAMEIEEAPRRRVEERKPRAERKRFTDADLQEMLGDMEPTPEPAPPLVMPEVDFIRWEPSERPQIITIPEHGESIAA
jgi:hypothetical protein